MTLFISTFWILNYRTSTCIMLKRVYVLIVVMYRTIHVYIPFGLNALFILPLYNMHIIINKLNNYLDDGLFLYSFRISMKSQYFIPRLESFGTLEVENFPMLCLNINPIFYFLFKITYINKITCWKYKSFLIWLWYITVLVSMCHYVFNLNSEYHIFIVICLK